MASRFTIRTRVARPVSEVFDAVRDPRKLSRYFTVGGASAPLTEGAVVTWSFREDSSHRFPVRVRRVIPNRRISFEWGTNGTRHTTRVEFRFVRVGRSATLVRISESGWKTTPAERKSSYDNCAGWMQMACCLKAFVEYGINLRKDAY